MYTYLLLILVLGIVRPVQLDALSEREAVHGCLDRGTGRLSSRLDNLLWASGGGHLLLIRAFVQVKSGKRIAHGSRSSLVVGNDLAAADTVTLGKLLGPVGDRLAVGLSMAHVVAVLAARGEEGRATCPPIRSLHVVRRELTLGLASIFANLAEESHLRGGRHLGLRRNTAGHGFGGLDFECD